MSVRKNSKSGLTFVEIMVTVLLFAMIVGGLYSTLLVGNVAWQNFEAVVRVQQETRRAVAMMTRDFRVAENLTVGLSDIGTLVGFHHPQEGNVTYSWMKIGEQAEQLIRQSPAGTRVIGRDITDFKVQDSRHTVWVSVTAKTVSRQGKEITFSLQHRIAKRN